MEDRSVINGPNNLATQSDIISGNPAYDAWVFGDGSDGAVVLDGTTAYAGFSSLSAGVYTLSRDIYPLNLSVSAGVVLATANYRVFVKNTLLGAGTIRNNGNAGGQPTAGAATPIGTLPANQAGTSGTSGTTAGTTANLTNSIGGRGGQGGATGFPNAASGTVAGPTQALGGLNALQSIPIALEMRGTGSSARYSTGTGGTGGSANPGSSGGGGASGCILLIAAPKISFTGRLEAMGGNGGNAISPAGGGGGGGGGFIALITRAFTLGIASISGNIRTQSLNTTLSAGFTLDVSGGAAGSSTSSTVSPIASAPGNLRLIATVGT